MLPPTKSIGIDRLAIFLIEPSGIQERIIKDHLVDLGVRREHISVAQEGNKALEQMRTLHPDLVISAMYLPDMTGSTLVESMHGSRQLEDIGYILISSETDVRMLEPIRQAGAIAILPKPFSQEQLRHALYTTLEFLEPDPLILEEQPADTLKVLMVDDSSLSRKHIRRTLEGIGIEDIIEARDGKQAIDALNTHYFDFIITDYNMPEMDGRELVDFIRNRSTQPGIPILMVTSERDSSRLSAVEQAGVSAICDKPFEPTRMKDYISRILATG